MGLFDFFIRRKQAATQACQQCAVDLDDLGVTCRRPNGTVESIKWAELRAVIIQTTSQGPFVDDIFWVLVGETGGCVVPSESVGIGGLIKRLQALQGFDNEAMIQAMTCTSDKEFLCWRCDMTESGETL